MVVMKEHYLDNVSTIVRSYYNSVKDLMLQQDEAIYEKVNKSMLTLKKKKNCILWLEPKGNILKIYFTKGKYQSKYYEIFPYGWGGYPYIKVRDNNFDLREIKNLIDQALSINNSKTR